MSDSTYSVFVSAENGVSRGIPVSSNSTVRTLRRTLPCTYVIIVLAGLQNSKTISPPFPPFPLSIAYPVEFSGEFPVALGTTRHIVPPVMLLTVYLLV